jgi:hypothetical protein
LKFKKEFRKKEIFFDFFQGLSLLNTTMTSIKKKKFRDMLQVNSQLLKRDQKQMLNK